MAPADRPDSPDLRDPPDPPAQTPPRAAQGDERQGGHTQGDETQGDETQGDGAQGDETQGDETQGDGTRGDERQGGQTQGDGAQGYETQGDETQSDETQGDGAQGDGARGDGARGDETQGDPRRQPPSPPEGPEALRESLWVFAAATALVAALYWTGKAVPFVQHNLGGLVALVFLVLPIHMLDRRGEPLARYGIDWRPLGRGVLWGVGTTVLVLGAFLAVYVAYYHATCSQGHTLLGPLGRRCSAWVGSFHQLALRTPPDFWSLALGQIVVVAIPEEVFYRGYVLGRLEQAFPARRHLWGSPVGTALLLQAALFGLGHFLVDFNPLRLAVAVPALAFGVLRHLGGGIVAPVILHASANILMLVVDRSFFPGT